MHVLSNPRVLRSPLVLFASQKYLASMLYALARSRQPPTKTCGNSIGDYCGPDLRPTCPSQLERTCNLLPIGTCQPHQIKSNNTGRVQFRSRIARDGMCVLRGLPGTLRAAACWPRCAEKSTSRSTDRCDTDTERYARLARLLMQYSI
jgi:hypothetical protein